MMSMLLFVVFQKKLKVIKLNMIKSFKDILKLLDNIPLSNESIKKKATEYQNTLLKPKNSLGLLEELAVFYCSWHGSLKPKIKKIQTVIFAGNHGVCNQSVNAFPQKVTFQMVENFNNGKAAVNQLSEEIGSNLKIVKLDLDRPTKDFTKEPAMSYDDFFKAFNIGFKSVKRNTDVLLLGEMGIGNSTVASAIISSLIGGKVSKYVGKGSSRNNKLIDHKIAIVKKGLSLNKNKSPLEVLRCLGGRELVAIFAATIQARLLKIPVIIDGFICTASIMPLFFLKKTAIDHCIFSHCSAEKGHKISLDYLEKRPLLSLDMCLGEATGALLALSILKSALSCHNNMGTFENSGVSHSIN